MKADYFARQVSQAKLHGYKPGFPSALFRERYGVWAPKEWSDKVKAEFDKDPAWQASLERRLKRKAEREAVEKRETDALSNRTEEKPADTLLDMDKLREQFRKAQALAPKSVEEIAMEATMAAMDSDPWKLAPESVDAPFADWVTQELE